jgi:hypothetical protein
MSLLRRFCEGRRSQPHPRTAMDHVPHLLVAVCRVEGCENFITDERAHRAVPAAYRPLLSNEWGPQFASLADIGAIDVIDVGLWDLQVEYPREEPS